LNIEKTELSLREGVKKIEEEKGITSEYRRTDVFGKKPKSNEESEETKDRIKLGYHPYVGRRWLVWMESYPSAIRIKDDHRSREPR